MTALLAFTGCMSLVITGELFPAFMVPGVAVLVGYYRFLRGYEPAPRLVISALSVVAVGLLVFDMTAISEDFFVAVAHMTIVFQALKSFDLRDPWDHLQVYFMSLLQLIMTSELAISLAVGGMFVVFLFMLVAAVVFSHFIREGTFGKTSLKKPVAALSLLAFVGTAIFFVSVPRAQGSFWSRKSSHGIRSVGFSEEVDFGLFGDILKDPSIVMRVSISGPGLPLYWRGITLDYFDGMAWKDTLKRQSRIYKHGESFDVSPGVVRTDDVTVQEIFLEPIDTEVIFGLGEVISLKSGSRYLFKDVAGSLYLPGKVDRRFSYTAYSIPGGRAELRRRYDSYYLQLPEGAERITALAREVAKGEDSDSKAAHAIESYLRMNYTYSLDVSPPAEGEKPVEHFLFVSKEGYCEHFATSMVLMLRSLGIPARIVTGYAGGEKNDIGDYIIIRQRDAHSWVEAEIGGKWERFDPTPPELEGSLSEIGMLLDIIRMNWYRYVVGFDFTDQRNLAISVTAPAITLPSLAGFDIDVSPAFLVALLGVIIFVAARVVLRGLPERRTFETKIYLKLRKVVKKRGGNIRDSSTPEEVLREALRVGMDAEGATMLLGMYEEVRFGGRKLDRGTRSRFRELARSACS